MDLAQTIATHGDWLRAAGSLLEGETVHALAGAAARGLRRALPPRRD